MIFIFDTWPKSQDKNLNILKRAFEVKWKSFLIIFKGLSVAKNCLRPESAPLRAVRAKLWWSKILASKTFEFLKKFFLFAKRRSIHVRWVDWKHAGALIRLSTSKQLLKVSRFQFSGDPILIIKCCPSKIILWKWELNLVRDLLTRSVKCCPFWLGGLYKPTRNHFLFLWENSKNIVSRSLKLESISKTLLGVFSL